MTSPDMDDEAMKAMARRIVKAHYPEMPADYRGRRYQIALAAIIETQERCAALAESHDGYNDITGTLIAAAIRSGQQFRKDV